MKETKFKQTEVGMIPSDWEVKSLSEITTRITVGIANSATHAYSDKGIIMFRNQNIKPNFLDDSDLIYIKESFETRYKNKRLKSFDLLVARTGYPGTACVVPAKYENSQTFTTLIVSPKNTFVESFFLSYYMNSQYGKTFFESSQIGGAQKNVNAHALSNMQIPFPPIDEQKHIVKVLSDIDSVISTTEKLIAKKKALKQGAMQTLLSGKMRIQNGKWIKTTNFKQTELGPIPQEWEVKTIGDLGSFLGGGTPSTKNESFWKGHIPWISSADLNDDDIDHISTTRFISQEAVNSSATQICPQGTILIIARVGVGKLALSAQKVCTSQDFCNLIPSKENNPKFLAYALLPVMKNMANESQGTSIKGVAVDEIKKTPIAVPSLKGEQTAIATVLSDMDSEIAALETKLAKYRQLKTGMMQQLLTGKVRLV